MRLASMKNTQPMCGPIFRLKLVLLMVFSALISGCDSTPTPSPADLIFTGGSIITMDDQQPLVEAIAISNGKIIRVGSSAEVLSHQTETTELIHLNQQALLPGFFDATVIYQGSVCSPLLPIYSLRPMDR